MSQVEDTEETLIEKPRFTCYQCGNEFRSGFWEGTKQCKECDRWIDCDRSRMTFFQGNDRVQELAEGPAAAPLESNTSAKHLVEKLKAPSAGRGVTRSRGKRGLGTIIYYLPGDERRAVTLFIEENKEYVADCLETKNNPLSRSWREDLYHLLTEQWHFLGYHDSDD